MFVNVVDQKESGDQSVAPTETAESDSERLLSAGT